MLGSVPRRRILRGVTTSRARRRPPGSPFRDPVAKPIKVFEVDDRVTHDKCGLGRVVSVEEEIAVSVAFADSTVRITAPYDQLHKL
jgi:hypothetical protein